MPVTQIPTEVLTFARQFRARFGDGVRLLFWATDDQRQGNPANDDPVATSDARLPKMKPGTPR